MSTTNENSETPKTNLTENNTTSNDPNPNSHINGSPPINNNPKNVHSDKEVHAEPSDHNYSHEGTEMRSRANIDLTVAHNHGNKRDDEELMIDIDVAADTADGKPYRPPNSFAAKKTVAQGMMDIALITANANQLRYIIEYTHGTKTYYLNLVLIVISLLLQVAVGISLIFKGRYDMKGMNKSIQAQRINNWVVVAVFLVTIINVFIASFTTTNPNVLPGPQYILPRTNEEMATEIKAMQS